MRDATWPRVVVRPVVGIKDPLDRTKKVYSSRAGELKVA